jgi:hypothetical protein
MSAKEKAISLVDSYRNILMNEDTQCGEEILCTGIAKRCALIAVDEILKRNEPIQGQFWDYWEQVKQEINKL